MSSAAIAQSTPASIAPPEGLSLSTVNAARNALENRAELTEAQLSAAKAAYDTAETALRNGRNSLAEAERLKALMETASAQLKNLEAETAAIRARPPVDMEEDRLAMNAQRLSDLQLALVNKEARLRALRTEQTSLRAELETLQSRRLIAPSEQTEFLTRAKELTAQIAQRGESQNDAAETALTAALKARLFYRRANAAALELEIASAADRQEILTARETLNQLQINYTGEEVAALQRLTGIQRLIDAAGYVSRAQGVLAGMTPPQGSASGEPSSASGNTAPNTSAPNRNTPDRTPPKTGNQDRAQAIEGVDILTGKTDIHPLIFEYATENLRLSKQLLSIAREASFTPKRQATKRSQIDIIDADLITAKSLIELGNLSRASATILRQLRNDNIALSVLEAEEKSVNQDIAQATQTLETLLGKSRELTALLEKNLLWLPSIAAIGFDWPGKVIKGAAAVFSGHNISLITDSLSTAAALRPLQLMGFVLLAGLLFGLRKAHSGLSDVAGLGSGPLTL